jgi:methylated-DNA-[protein]-cysteine S-methyltransferase
MMTTHPNAQPGAQSDASFLAPLAAEDDRAFRALSARLAQQAARDGILDVAYRTIDTPVGELLLAATERGLIRVAYPAQDHDAVLSALATQVSPRVLHAPARLDAVARQLDEYFARTRQSFGLDLDLQLAHGFRRVVLEHLRQIGYGSTASYGAVAAASGSPAAVRAVGTACARNPLPVVIPCHRVVRGDGSIGQYAGGAEAKRALLELEAA